MFREKLEVKKNVDLLFEIFDRKGGIITALNWLFCFIGFMMLNYGAEWLLKGSAGLARSLGLTPIVIGLTVVAFGTSAPELVVRLISSIQDKSMIAVGNVVGSNTCNIALVLVLAAVFQPITSDSSVVK